MVRFQQITNKDLKKTDPAKSPGTPDPNLGVDEETKKFEQRVKSLKDDYPYEEEESLKKLQVRSESVIKRVDLLEGALKRVGMPGVARGEGLSGDQAWKDRVDELTRAVAILNKGVEEKRITPEQFKAINDSFVKARTDHLDGVKALVDDVKRVFEISAGARTGYTRAVNAYRADRSEGNMKALYEASVRLAASDERCTKFEKSLKALDDTFFKALDIE